MPGSNARALEKARSASRRRADSGPRRRRRARRQGTGPQAGVRGGEGAAASASARSSSAPTRFRPPGARPISPPPPQARPDAILIPEGFSARAIWKPSKPRLVSAGADAGIALWAMVETPLAILNIGADRGRGRQARLLRDGHQRSDQGISRACTRRTAQNLSASLGLSVAAARAYGLGDCRWRLQRYPECRRLRRFLQTGPRLRLRRQDADPSHAGRALQQRVRAERRGSGSRAEDHRRVRIAGEQGQGRHLARRAHGRAAARGNRARHGGAGRRHRGAGSSHENRTPEIISRISASARRSCTPRRAR